MSKYKDIISGSFFLLVAILLFVQSYSIQTFVDAEYGSTFVPRLVAIIVGLLSIVTLISGIRNLRMEGSKVEGKSTFNSKPIILTVVLMVVYAFIFKQLGFIVSTVLYLVLQMYILSNFNRKKILLFAIVSVIATVSLYFIFNKLLHVMLPSGILG